MDSAAGRPAADAGDRALALTASQHRALAAVSEALRGLRTVERDHFSEQIQLLFALANLVEDPPCTAPAAAASRA